MIIIIIIIMAIMILGQGKRVLQRQRKQVLAINALRLPSKRIKLAAKASLLISTVI